jgi:putative acetyltransferase
MKVRYETPADLVAIDQVNLAAFGRRAEGDLVRALRGAGAASLSLVAVESDAVVGHILFSQVSISARPDVRALGLAPMSVAPESQRKGAGSLLVKTGLEECGRAGWQGVVVLGHPAYYPRFGFVPASRFGLRCEYDVPDDTFMAIELEAGAFGVNAGIVKYPHEFTEFE